MEFLRATQPKTVEALGIGEDGSKRLQFLHRLQGEVAKRGIIDVLRKGIRHGPADAALFYWTPTPGNTRAEALFQANIFSVTRQLRYSKDETQLALDMAILINGLPVATFELKNRLTKQTVEDAVQQYKRDRDPKELLFQFGRCAVHLAVDDQEVRMCTSLAGRDSWFLPFNKGFNDGAGNPPNPQGIKTDYLWREILTPRSLTDILENYAQTVEEKEETGRKRRRQIFPRYHQLDVVHKLLADVQARGAGKRYLIEHSAGSGKSNSIAWLAHQLIALVRDGAPIFDSIIVVTDRKVLDKQIKDTIKQFAQVSATVGHAEGAGDLRRFLTAGKKIIISTVQKFPFILDEIGDEHRGRTFAIIIDEAHSSQGGRTSAKMNIALAEHGAGEEEETVEDVINRIMESRKMLGNASYFAFTATPKNKTLEIFGEAFQEGGKVKHKPFHSYTMKQAIQEGFILDVLRNYTPVSSYYRLMKTVPDDPQFDTKKARTKLRRYVESHEQAIRQKAEIMVDHFLQHVLAHRKIGGDARAMVVTGSIKKANRAVVAPERPDGRGLRCLQQRRDQLSGADGGCGAPRRVHGGRHLWGGAESGWKLQLSLQSRPGGFHRDGLCHRTRGHQPAANRRRNRGFPVAGQCFAGHGLRVPIRFSYRPYGRAPGRKLCRAGAVRSGGSDSNQLHRPRFRTALPGCGRLGRGHVGKRGDERRIPGLHIAVASSALGRV